METITAAGRTLPELFFAQVRARGPALALRHKVYGIWQRVSWDEYGEAVRRVAGGLLASGLARGERVAILGDNRPEWLYCHLGTMAAGGATCGIYATSSPEQVRYLLQHSGARYLFLDNEEQLEKVNLASSAEEESRYSQHTLGDMRANLDGARRTYDLFAPWLRSVPNGADIAIFAGDRRGIIYVQGEKVANVPEDDILDALSALAGGR